MTRNVTTARCESTAPEGGIYSRCLNEGPHTTHQALLKGGVHVTWTDEAPVVEPVDEAPMTGTTMTPAEAAARGIVAPVLDQAAAFVAASGLPHTVTLICPAASEVDRCSFTGTSRSNGWTPSEVVAHLTSPFHQAQRWTDPTFLATWALLADDQGLCPDGHPCQLATAYEVGDPSAVDGAAPTLRHCEDLDHDYIGSPIIADGVDHHAVAKAARFNVDLALVEWAVETVGARRVEALEDEVIAAGLAGVVPTAPAVEPALIEEASGLAALIADTLANGVLPEGLWDDREAQEKLVQTLALAAADLGLSL